MLPWTRGLRKEFLPLFDPGANGEPVLKPVLHLVLESLLAAGIQEVGLVVRPKDVDFVSQYFSVDQSFLKRHAKHAGRLAETRRFYETLGRLEIEFFVQREPKGFGDAVRTASRWGEGRPVLLHAADAFLVEPHRGGLIRTMIELYEQEHLDAVLLVRQVADPRRYGVIEGITAGSYKGLKRLHVTGMVEKPEHPKTHWAATAVYVLSPAFFHALDAVNRELRHGELEVTDALRRLLDEGRRIDALVLNEKTGGEWRSVGSPDRYMTALQRTQRMALKAHARRANG
jgi:dTDP-glucose pyrophosphorylase